MKFDGARASVCAYCKFQNKHKGSKQNSVLVAVPSFLEKLLTIIPMRIPTSKIQMTWPKEMILATGKNFFD